jgi:hypothetical protein
VSVLRERYLAGEVMLYLRPPTPGPAGVAPSMVVDAHVFCLFRPTA